MRIKDDEKITRIYRAAIKVINRDGFQGSSMSKIAKEADVSAATIYLYFENKDDMIDKLYIQTKSKMGKSYFHEGIELSPSKSTFRTIWINHYQYITRNIDEYIFQENFANCPLIEHVEKKYNMDYCPTFEQLFEKSKAARLILPMDNDFIYSLLFAPISSLVKKQKIAGTEISMNDLIQIFESSWKSISQ
ncbi:MAG: TetR/AcrR family transcriptional regulator [Paludibacter sp.]|nr:TetR/AcrR family transcriptional regulator [Paludibacter sp.]